LCYWSTPNKINDIDENINKSHTRNTSNTSNFFVRFFLKFGFIFRSGKLSLKLRPRLIARARLALKCFHSEKNNNNRLSFLSISPNSFHAVLWLQLGYIYNSKVGSYVATNTKSYTHRSRQVKVQRRRMNHENLNRRSRYPDSMDKSGHDVYTISYGVLETRSGRTCTRSSQDVSFFTIPFCYFSFNSNFRLVRFRNIMSPYCVRFLCLRDDDGIVKHFSFSRYTFEYNVGKKWIQMECHRSGKKIELDYDRQMTLNHSQTYVWTIQKIYANFETRFSRNRQRLLIFSKTELLVFFPKQKYYITIVNHFDYD